MGYRRVVLKVVHGRVLIRDGVWYRFLFEVCVINGRGNGRAIVTQGGLLVEMGCYSRWVTVGVVIRGVFRQGYSRGSYSMSTFCRRSPGGTSKSIG